jgi:23S rRNA pseudouridine955/2504/2580 synthase
VSGSPESFWAALPLGSGVKVLARDANGLVALLKPVGVLSHPNTDRDQAKAVLQAPYDLDRECFQWAAADGTPRRLWLLNRLDSATSGVILAAATEVLAAAVKAEFRQREVRKVYQALVFGVPREPAQSWRDRLTVEKRGGQIRSNAGGGVLAECRMRLVRSKRGEPPLSLLRLEPQTGRSHQLRVQCARRRLPIVGDQTYGEFRLNREFAKETRNKRLFLHALETSFTYRFGGRDHAFAAAAPLPPEFTACL